MSLRLSEHPVTQATLALHRYICIPFWNQDDPNSDNLPFGCGPKAQ